MNTAYIRFLQHICPRPDHCCNGIFLKDREFEAKDIGKCQYYYAIRGCCHPQRPVKRRKKG
jgi:hypothetical protein